MMKLLLPLLFLFVFNTPILAQSVNPLEKWLGYWKGNLEIFNAEGKKMEAVMELQILPTDSLNRWKWTIIYGEGDKKDERPYELVAVDLKKGHFVMDEKNTILIDTYLINQTFYSNFTVEGSQLIFIDRLEGDQIIVEVISSSNKAVGITGGTSKDIPSVESFPIHITQKAILKKYKEVGK